MGYGRVMHGSWGKIDYRRLGEIEHIKSLRRHVIPDRVVNSLPRSVLDRYERLFYKWRLTEYPGQDRISSQILGVHRDHVRKIRRGKAELSNPGRARLIAVLETQAREINSILEALKAEQAAIDKRNATDPKYNLQARMEKARQAYAKKKGQPDRASRP